MTQRDEVQKFEHGRIKVLQEERLHIQKKTFTKWMNSFLQKARMEVEDLFVDLADGVKLLKLLEIISGEKLAKPTKGMMRVHKIENVNKSLAFLHTKVRLESIGAEDIVDGNPRLILGLIWTIILRFQIQEIEIDVDEENESSEKKSAKDALLLWAQRKTNGYQGVQINDFTGSWRTGLAFNALIHSHRPDLFDYSLLPNQNNLNNLNHAFDVANNELGIPPLLDAEDIDTLRPDEKSVMTYVASYYHTFARMKNEQKSGRRIEKIIRQIVDADKMKNNYDKLTQNLLQWIQKQIENLENRDFPNSLEAIQGLLINFGIYRTQEKPPKYLERSEIEALFFNINTQLKELRQALFVPQEGHLLQDIGRAWEQLEKAEYKRELDLRSELMRQKRLEQINYNFERKSFLRENFLKEMIQVLSDPRYGSNLTQIDATVKKHEAISADIMAREERFHNLTQMCEELVKEKYKNATRVQAREQEVLNKWSELLSLLNKHKFNLNRLGNVMDLVKDLDTTLININQLKMEVSSIDIGVHLLAVEKLLQEHALQTIQVNSFGEKERKLKRIVEQAIIQNPKEEDNLKTKLNQLDEAYKDLQISIEKRRALLEEARNFYQFLQDQEDEEAWLIEKQRICQAGITAKDLRGVLSLQQKHKLLLDEIKARKNKFDELGNAGRQLIKEMHPKIDEIQQHIERNRKNWTILEELADERTKNLQDAAEAYQFYADSNEADSWLAEKNSILASKDYGSDEPSAQALLQRHRDLQGELNAYNGDIQSLNGQAERLIAAGISNMDLGADDLATAALDTPEEIIYENKMVPTEVYEDETVEKVQHRTVNEERKVPQVKALYPFSDHGLTMNKGETMILLNKSNPDWWCVRKSDGTEGFAPANYVKECEPRTIQIQVRKPEKIKTIKTVKKTKLLLKKVPIPQQIIHKKQPVNKLDDSNNVPKRLKNINENYDKLQTLASKRLGLLEDAIKLFAFFRECNDFNKWIKDKERLLLSSTQDVDEKRIYEKFVTDLSASNKRIQDLEEDVGKFAQHPQINEVKALYSELRANWVKLNELKSQKERNLAGASSVELFQRICDEATDWMMDKMQNLDTEALGHDLKTVQALQRRHQNLERELAPLEEKVNRVDLLAQSVKSSYPREQLNVDKRQVEIQKLWGLVKDKAMERRTRLEDAVGQQIFTNSSKALLHWVANIKEQLNADNTVRDVQTAKNMLKLHQDLEQDIKSHDDEFKQITDLGEKLLKSNPTLTDVSANLNRLAEEQPALARGWKEKDNWLQQCLQLQMFNKEADNIDAASSSHQAFLEFSDLGNSLDEVEALLKQQNAFANTLVAQDTGIAQFTRNADKLISEEHYDSQSIDEKRAQVLQKRDAVKDSSQKRSQTLDASKNYQEFCAEVDDLRAWLAEKLRTASDESYRDLNNLERKLQKHEAFERELRANEGQLRTVNKLGQSLIAQNSYRKNDVVATLKDLNDLWGKLAGISLEKRHRLGQAEAQHSYNRRIEDVNTKIDEIANKLKSTHVGTDLRSCQDLLKKHDLLETELNQISNRVDTLANQSQDMTHDDHFDSATICDDALLSKKRVEDLNKPIQMRKDALEEAKEFYKFNFELDNELQWIKEHMPQASSEILGQNLHQAQNMFKKHKKLETEILGHRPIIQKTLESGETLINQKHPEKQQVQQLCDDLEFAWTELNENAAHRAGKLDLSLKAQQFFFEANEVESWLNERQDVLASTDYGRDRDGATKLLTKHKALELELDTYSSIIAEMGRGAAQLVQSAHPESKAIADRQSSLEHLVRSLQRKAAMRQHRLMESLFRHEYFLESEDLERWIIEQYQQAASEDYGQDYEHLLLLQAKFDDFKHRIEAGSERFKQCEDLAQKLIANESPYTTDIEKKQQELGERWSKLREQIENREQRLHAAGEIHRFHRDVSDALSRIHVKNASLGTELGRDLNSALSLLRKQEAFENELVVLEAQLQVLVDDAPRLKTTYPTNKLKLAQQQNLVVEAWQGLKERTEMRRDQLQASVDLQKFLTQVRDLINWASEVRLGMNAQDVVRSASKAQNLKDEHDALKGEIEAREDAFQAAADLSIAMEQTGHYAAAEAVERCQGLFAERQKLHTAWQLRKIHLDQLNDLHLFLREAKQLENISNTQEAALGNTDFGETVEEVARQLKKHEEFEKLINVQDEKLDALLVTGDKLLSQKHFESGRIASKLADIQEKRYKIRQLSGQKKLQLSDALLYAEFIRDVADVLHWVAEKEKKLESESVKTGENVSNLLEDKIKKLQKHQAFQSEVAANVSRMEEVRHKGETLVSKRHKASPEIDKQLAQLDDAWKRLIREVDLRGKGLEEAQDILEFNNQLDKIDAWIRDKEVLVQAADIGRDYEHCQALQRKLEDVDSDMRVDDTRIRIINVLAEKLMKQGHAGVQERRNDFIKKWQHLQGALNEYREQLAGASEVHSFNRDVADTSQRILEKTAAMEVDDIERDLNGVEGLQRKQEAKEMEMTAVEAKMTQHVHNAAALSQIYPHNSKPIANKIDDLQSKWGNLVDAKENRKQALEGAYTKQKFLTDTKDLDLWCLETEKRMETQHKPISVVEAEAHLELHDELKVEIDGRLDEFNKLIIDGENLAQNNDPKIVEAVEKLKDMQENILYKWMQHKKNLTHEYQLQNFKEQADQLDNWLASKEAFLNNEDIGDNPRSVDALIRKHQDFESMLTQQMLRIHDLEQIASTISSEIVKERLEMILKRKNNLIEAAQARKLKLEQSKSLHEFIRNIHEVESWLIQKIQTATDENYRDSSNLQSKIQKHLAFDSEINVNNQRIQTVINEGHELIWNKHFASKEIETRLEDLNQDLSYLLEQTQIKKERLQDAYQALLFNRSLDEFEAWLTEIEQQLQSNDHGKDLATVNNQLKKHGALENDVQQHTKNCEGINETGEQFVKNNHFMGPELQKRAHVAITRFHKMLEPMQVRRDSLEASSMLQQYTRDVDDELQWLDDREPLAASEDLGQSLNGVQSLHKKHQTLEAELISREPIVINLVNRAAQLTRSGHDSADLIHGKAIQLKTKLMKVGDLANIRRLRLQDALESQMYYAEAAETQAWIGDKRPLLISGEIGRDEDSTHALQRKLEALNLEIDAFKKTVERLKNNANNLIDRNHFDADNIAHKQKDIEDQFNELVNLLSDRETRLSEALSYFGFIREYNEVQEWISDQQIKAASEDYGTDVEHVELITQTFEIFLISLTTSELRVHECVARGEELIASQSNHSVQIEKNVLDLNEKWADLMELAQARRDALDGAKKIHEFDRTADETITWIQEKESIINLDNYGHDLDSIQALVRKHSAFESELLAVKELVDSVESDGQKLIELYPDAEDHIEVKREDVLTAWEGLQTNAGYRRDKLQQAEQLESYFDQQHDLLAWINEMLAKITGPELPNDVTGAELLIERHREHKVEIDARGNSVKQFFNTGNNLIKNGHFFENEIKEKIRILQQRMDLLIRTWDKRSIIYDQNLDVQLFKREANILENWLIVRESALRDGKLGDNIMQVEDLIRKHEDFENTIKAQEEKFAALRRITLLEEAFEELRISEENERKFERERQEIEKLTQRKRMEMQRITELRRLEDAREKPPPPSINGNNNNESNGANNNLAVPTTPGSTLTKSNSVAHMFGDRIRRGSDANIKRAESMKVTGPAKLPKRTPSFTTRRRGSFRGKLPGQQAEVDEVQLPPVEIQGFLDRKQVLAAGGKRATNRTWRNLYTVLCGQLLCFFKNRDDFGASKAICAPMGIHNAHCTRADDYSKRKHTLRLIMLDQSEFLFSCTNQMDLNEWVTKISFRAKLPPSQQLLHFEVHKDDYSISPQSSRTSSPDVTDSNIVLRHDPTYANGNSGAATTGGHRPHTFTGESSPTPPPLPMSQPPPNARPRLVSSSSSNAGRVGDFLDHHGYGNNSGSGPDGRTTDWSSPRPSSIQPGAPGGADQKKSSRIMDLFKRKRQPSSQM